MITQSQIQAMVKPGADVYIKGASFEVPTIVNLTGSQIRSLTVQYSKNLVFKGLDIQYTPNAFTAAWSPAVTILFSSYITLSGGTIRGGPAVNGVPLDAIALDKSQNVLGLPCGVGVSIGTSDNVLIENLDISLFERGIMCSKLKDSIYRNNRIHDLRKTSMGGAEISNLLTEENTLGSSHPWRWGQTPLGDHCDCLAFWSNATQTIPNDRVVIKNNRMIQPTGLPDILGMWFQGTPVAPFVDFQIKDNLFMLNNLQGVSLKNSNRGSISGNTMLRNGPNMKQAPGVLLGINCSDVSVVRNVLSAVFDTSGNSNLKSDNIFIQGQII